MRLRPLLILSLPFPCLRGRGAMNVTRG
jgi:hypothetical protein